MYRFIVFRFSFFCFSFFVLFGCRNSSTEENGTFKIDWNKAEKQKNAYAQGFSIEQSGKYYRISVKDPQTGKQYGKFVLYPEKGEKPVISDGETAIAYPVKSFASVSTTHLPFLKLLGEEKSLCGFAGQKFVLSDYFKELFKLKIIPELGADNALDHEKLIELFPDVFMVYPFGALNYSKIEESGIPVFYNTDYLELHPLGKTEWIKIFGLLFDKSLKADTLFNDVSRRYHQLNVNTSEVFKTKEYTVFTGLNFGGTWYVPGGKSFQARFLRDAEVNYIWRNDKNNNSLTLPAEVVIDKCIDADYWIIVSSEKPDFTFDDLMAQNPQYRHFKAAKNKNILFCNSSEKDYFGEAIVEPDVVLADLIKLIHEPVYHHELKYFHRLK